MPPTVESIKVLVGIEIHVELATQTKMFCRCINNFGDPPNTHVCPVCTSMPGALPVMNKKAVADSIKVALALGCTVPAYTKWDRKNYYYPDLPKGYQLSQYDLPLGEHGELTVPLADGSTHTVRVLRAHLEEDAGKNIHDNPDHTGVDLNRAGVPLLEIVSEPDIHSSEQAVAYGRAMQRLVRWLGVSHANMQMGHMRFEPNINLHIVADGVTYKTPIIEVKNLNSFKALEGAISYEVKRHYAEWQKNPEGFTIEKLGKQNRGWDDVAERTIFQRDKEEAHDYRYFPDPDLPAVTVSDEWRQSIQDTIGELPLARRARYISELGLDKQSADALTLDAPTGDLLDAAIAAGATPKICTNLLLGRGLALAKERECTIAELGIKADGFAELAKMLADKDVNATAGEKIFLTMIETGESPKAIAEAEGLLAVTDTAQLDEWVNAAIEKNPQAVEIIREGGKKKEKSFGFLMGQVMQLSRGAAPPADVQKLLRQKLDS